MKDLLAPLLAWHDGGEYRPVLLPPTSTTTITTVPDPPAKASDPPLWDIMTSLGPWAEADIHMLKSIMRFRRDVLPGVMAGEGRRRRRKEEEEEEGGKAPEGGVRIVYGIMLHDYPARFEALWEALHHDHHYYIIHVDRSAQDPELRQQIMDIINRTTTTTPGGIWDHVLVIEEDRAVKSLWGDITLVYSEFELWMRLFEMKDWEWDYFINMSG